MRVFLTLFLVCFLALCGWLIVRCVLAEGICSAEGLCILLQQTQGDSRSAETTQPLQETRLEAAEVVGFDADPGRPQQVVLGSTDPKSGFEFELEMSSKGAAIRTATFSRFDDRDHEAPQPLVALGPVEGELSLANREFIFVEQKLQLRLQGLHWASAGMSRNQDGSEAVTFEAVIKAKASNAPVVRLTKTYRVHKGSYMLDCDLTVENLSSGGQKVRYNIAGPMGIGREGFRSDMRKVVGGFIGAGPKDEPTGERYEITKYGQKKEFEEKRIEGVGSFLWAAVVNKYFAAILVPVAQAGEEYCGWVKDKRALFYNADGQKHTGDENIGVLLKTAPVALAPAGQGGSKRDYRFQLYLGPKDKSRFDKNELYHSLGFVQTIDFMACCCPAAIIRPIAFGIMATMKWMYGFIGNYGVVIIILVVVIRIVIHPLTKKSQVSMSKMTKLGPRAEEIKKKYADNKAELNKQLMALYREQGASPIMGMLPMMAQLPILIALWSAIYTSIDLRGAPFLPFWITDLSVPDALIRFSTITMPLLGWKVESLNLLPILMGVAMYLQQKLMPSPAAASASPQAAQQQKMMMIMMP
ncbi:MAG: YidC/Oxa1 family insertase periplasmic-domain containing protein, partial [Planctomycetota bacterium]